MKYIREVSDLHLDFDVRNFIAGGAHKRHPDGDLGGLWYPIPLDTDSDTCLILAGDIWDSGRFLTRINPTDQKSWLKRVSERFKYVVFVLGNHDFWGANLTDEYDKIQKRMQEQEIMNCFMLDGHTIVLDQVKFTGGTLWTDYDKGNPLEVYKAPSVMKNVIDKIKVGGSYRRLRVEDLLYRHKTTRDHIFANATKDNPEQRVIVVTHMAPSAQSIHSFYRGGSTNHFYYSNLENELAYQEHDIEFWFHGHTHHPFDYNLGPTRVICNPRGYDGYEHTGYDEIFIIEV